MYGFVLCFQLTECCVNVLVTSFKETILAECAPMIKANETGSKLLVTFVSLYKLNVTILLPMCSDNCTDLEPSLYR